MTRHLLPSLLTVVLLLKGVAGAQVIINEIHYNPVELPAFDAGGNPVFQGTATPADFTDDVHEFVELHNPTASPLSIAGWRLEGGVDFTFPAGTTIAAGGWLVVAKNAARIQTVYAISGVLGPFANGSKLNNKGDTVRLVTPSNVVSDSVSYEASFPWAISASKLGAGDDFTLLNSASYQYKGRSLQRVSATASSNDPANWVAVRPSPFADLPTPGAANIVTLAVPKPVVTAQSATQLSDGAVIISSTSQVRILATFSSNAALSNVQVDYFVDNINAFGESPITLAMTALGNNQYSATLPSQANRSIVRYRIKADRGAGVEVVSPRADDPAVVPTAVATRQAWHSYFVTPTGRSTAKPNYDCFVSTTGAALSDSLGQNVFFPYTGLNGLQTMAYDATGDRRRITVAAETTQANPRELPYVTTADRIWNRTVPAVFVENGFVRDIQLRFHGSRWNRRPSRKSYKMIFQDYQHYQDADSVFITDKLDSFATAHGLYQAANLPISGVRYVDWYFNSDAMQTRLEQGEYNGDLLDLYHEKMQRLNPGSPREETGEYYKAVGLINGDLGPTVGEGPYGAGNGVPMPPTGGSPSWTELKRAEYTYLLQNHAWKGADPIRDLVNGMWTARGDTWNAPNPNLTTTKAWFEANWDVQTELTSLALGNWMAPWDDTTQNHFLWRRANGKWARTLWDFDSMYAASGDSIYHAEVGDSSNNFRGPNYFVDSFLKCYRTEYKQRLWFLNNTLLDPENLATLTFKNSGGGTVTYAASIGGFAASRFTNVNTQVALGIFYKPTRPTNTAPAAAAVVLPGASFTASAYAYNAANTHTAAPVTSPHASSKWEIRTAAGTYDDPAYVLTSTTNLTSLPIPFGELTYGQTYSWRVTYFAADGHPSITSAETSFSYGVASPTAGNITINEVMAENLIAVANGEDHPDYVELKNNTGGAINITGWNLTDDELVPAKYTFPATTSIPANGYLMVWCDGSTGSPGLHSGFALSRKGQRVLLIQSGTVRDAITFGPQMPDSAIGRFADGNGAWRLVNASPGATNTARTFSTVTTTLKINEWMAVPASGEDWFEIHNSGALPVAVGGLWLSDTAGTPKITAIPALSFVAAGGCARFDADGTTAGFNSANFKLSSGGDNLILTTANGLTTIDAYSFGAQLPGVSQGRFPDGTGAFVSFPVSASPNGNNWLPAPVRINEALTNSVLPLEDSVEIYNPTASPVDIGGWWLSDDRFTRKKYQFAPGTTVPAGGYLSVPESQFNVGVNAFSLSSLGDEIVLSAATAGGVETGYRSQFGFGAAADGVSFGYVATALAPEFWPQVSRTPDAFNSASAIGPVVINEVHYHPPDLAGPVDNTRDEFVELHNITTSPVSLADWRLKGGTDFTFAAGTTLLPGDYILVVGFNPATDAASLAAFRAALSVPVSVPIYGPFTPKLANDSTNVEIAWPGAPVGAVTPFINVDKVEYADFAPWSAAADAGGSSLQRLSRAVIGNDAANWSGVAPTPGAVNTGQTPIPDSDGDGMPDAWETAHGLNRFSSADAALDSDGDGQNNVSEYIAGTNPLSAASSLTVSATKPAGSGSIIHFTALAGHSYRIQWRADLASGSWQDLVTIPAPGVDTAIHHSDPTGDPRRFYRVVTP